MKQFSLVVGLLICSVSAHSALNKGQDNMDKKPASESRQNKARDILKNNYNVLENMSDKKMKKTNFGFRKEEKEDKQSL